jgi:hypothetical protein
MSSTFSRLAILAGFHVAAVASNKKKAKAPKKPQGGKKPA